MSSRRILSIWLMRLALDRWHLAEGESAAPLALIAETAHGPRIAAANAAGLEAGARPGMMLADARALCPALAVAPSDPAGDLAFLEKLALWAQRWGPWSAVDPPDGVLIDITGAAHLFGGEARLLGHAGTLLAGRGLAARLAIAPTAGAAWALAHYGPQSAIFHPGDSLDELPVAALRLDAEVLLLLRRLGLRRIGDIAGIGRDALARRFRTRRAPAANPLVRLDQLLGRVPEPLLPVVAHDVPLVQRRLVEPIRHRALLERVVADLAEALARVLEGRSLGARRLELSCWRVDGEVIRRHLELASSSRDAGHITGLFGARLDGVEAGFGIELVRLAAPWAERLALSQADLDAAAETHGTSLAACIDRLTVRLGAEAVRRPVLHASHLPERAQRWEGLADAADSSVRLTAEAAPARSPARPPNDSSLWVAGPIGGNVPRTFPFPSGGSGPVPQVDHGCDRRTKQERPLKLLDRAEPIAVIHASPDGLPRRFRWRGAVHEVARAEGPERIAPEWWRERSSTRLRDYYRIEDEAGRRYWIYRAGIAGDGRGGAPEWFLQGLCG